MERGVYIYGIVAVDEEYGQIDGRWKSAAERLSLNKLWRLTYYINLEVH